MDGLLPLGLPYRLTIADDRNPAWSYYSKKLPNFTKVQGPSGHAGASASTVGVMVGTTILEVDVMGLSDKGWMQCTIISLGVGSLGFN